MNSLFVSPPQDFDQLAHAARTKRGGGFGKEPDLRTVGERTYSAFEAVQFAPLQKCNAQDNTIAPHQCDWLHIPYALWLGEERGLHAYPRLTQHYFEVAVP